MVLDELLGAHFLRNLPTENDGKDFTQILDRLVLLNRMWLNRYHAAGNDVIPATNGARESLQTRVAAFT